MREEDVKDSLTEASKQELEGDGKKEDGSYGGNVKMTQRRSEYVFDLNRQAERRGSVCQICFWYLQNVKDVKVKVEDGEAWVKKIILQRNKLVVCGCEVES